MGLEIHVRNRRVNLRFLTLEKEINMLLVQSKWQRESLDVEGDLALNVIEAEHVEFADNGLNRPFEFTDTLLFARIMFNDVWDYILGNGYLLKEFDILERRIDEVLVRDDEFLLEIEP